MADMKKAPVSVNGRNYRWMDRPLVVVSVDGCEPDYITQAMQAGVAKGNCKGPQCLSNPSPILVQSLFRACPIPV